MRLNRLQITVGVLVVALLVLMRWQRQSLSLPQADAPLPKNAAAGLLQSTPLLSTLPVTATATVVPGRPVKRVAVVDAVAGAPRHLDARFPNRLRNTDASLDTLIHTDTALLLRHALVDTASDEPISIPSSLRAAGDPGMYIVQASKSIDPAFRRAIQRAGGQVISYIPNNALLVQMTAEGVDRLGGSSSVGSVLAFEPYFKFDALLLDRVLKDGAFTGTETVVATVSGDAAAVARVEQQMGNALARATSPFGTLLTLQVDAAGLTALAQSSDVSGVELYRPRSLANDLAGYVLGSVTDTNNTLPYLGLTGKDVVLGLNDAGVDFSHVAIRDALLPVDPTIQAVLEGSGSAHGTHVAAIMVGNGAGNVLHVPQGSGSNAVFRGRAPGAKLFAQPVDLNSGPSRTDEYLQTNAAANEVHISNNSWAYRGTIDYSSSSASFDAAVRDSLPGVPGAQPVVYVFAAGNEGYGDEIGTGGIEDSISAPGNAKNVITVGALETFRALTNDVVIDTNGVIIPKSKIDTNAEPGTYTTNVIYKERTDSGAQVAHYSSRGNVGIGIEGDFGRFKPDVVAPGSFIVSARGKGWKLSDQLQKDTTEYEARYEMENDLGGNPEDDGITDVYRYESGTSMAAPSISGLLAQLEEFFVTTAKTNRPSPALARALLINGARPTSDAYAINPREVVNYAGWGRPFLPNSIPAASSTNFNTPPSPLLFIEEAYTNAISTGTSKSWRIKFNKSHPEFSDAVVRFTLVWTDPPGNPAASVKLVNDLDLIVTRRGTNDGLRKFYYGNDYLPNINRSRLREAPAGEKEPPANPTENQEDLTKLDKVNNVESVTFDAPEEEYVVSVVGRRVNVQSLGVDHPGVPDGELTLQDWTLVVSIETPNPAGLISEFEFAEDKDQLDIFIPPVDILTNGLPRLHERVGANSPRAGTQIGQLEQWHFYTFTNYNGVTNSAGIVYGTNVAFAVFSTPNLGVVRSTDADVDLFVSLDSRLTNLNATALSGSLRSVKRGGSEMILITNAPNTNEIFYIGVKAEDQQAAEYNIIGISSDKPFNSRDPDGRLRVTGFPVDQPIPDGTPRAPGRGLFIGFGLPGEIRSILAEQTMSHEMFSDLLGNLEHDRVFSVLNNRQPFGNYSEGTNIYRLYDDSFSGAPLPVFTKNIPGMIGLPDFNTNGYKADGPGSLNNFLGESMEGAWIFSSFDNAGGFVGRVNQLDLRIFENDLLDGLFHHRRVEAGKCVLEVRNVPADASRMRVVVTNMTPALPLQVLIRRSEVPDLVAIDNNDKNADLLPPGGEVSIGVRDVPPLQAGRYFIAVCNPNAVAVEYDIAIILERNLDPRFSTILTSTEAMTNLDLSLGSVLTNLVDDRNVTGVKLGLRIDQPQVSDLKVHLANSSGKALITENRGLRSAAQYGMDIVRSNYQHVAVTYDDYTSWVRLYYNGALVAESRQPGLKLPTTSTLHLGMDPSTKLAATKVPVVLDDFGLWRRSISRNEILRIYDSGLIGRGKTLSDRSRLLLGHWRLDGNGNDSVSSYNAVLAGNWLEVTGQAGTALALTGATAQVIVPAQAVSDLGLAVRGRSGFTLDGWIAPTSGVQNVVVGSFWTGVAAEAAYPALLVGFDGNLGNGAGSLSAVFQRTNGALFTLSTPAGLVTRTGVETNIVYAQFSDSSTIPIKFATPPYTGAVVGNTIFDTDGFETVFGEYAAGTSPEGWDVLTEPVLVVDEPLGAAVGRRYLQLQTGIISKAIPTIPGQVYKVRFASRTTLGEIDVPEVEVYVDGDIDRLLRGTDAWVTNTVVFRAAGDSTRLEFRARPSVNLFSGMALDNFQFERSAGTTTYLPEEPMTALLGRPAVGDWRVDLTDDRGGVSDAILKSWQLTVMFAPTNTPATRLLNDVSFTSCDNGGVPLKNESLQYFYVDVPLEAQAVTNILERLSGNSALDLLYSASGLPDGNQADDVVLLQKVNTRAAAGLNRSFPPLLPRGQRYYLAVRNSNPSDTETCFRLTVQFGVPIVQLTNCTPYAAKIRNEGLINYFAVDVPSDALALRINITNMTEDVDMVVRKAPGLPTKSVFDYAGQTNSARQEEVVVYSGSEPVSLSAGVWYIGVYAASTNVNVRDIAFDITACPVSGEKTVLKSGDVVQKTNTLSLMQYFCIDVTRPSLSMEVLVKPISGDVDAMIAFARTPDVGAYDAISQRFGLLREDFVLLRDNVGALQLQQGRYWVAVYPKNATPVTYTISARIVPDDGNVTELFDSLDFAIAGAQAPATNYYRFTVPEGASVRGLLFEAYNLSADVDLYARLGTLPQPDFPYFASVSSGLSRELIVVREANVAGGNLSGDWYVAAVLKDTAATSYSVRASFVVTGLPLIPVMQFSSTPGVLMEIVFDSIPGERYRVEYADSLVAPQWFVFADTVASGNRTTVPITVADAPEPGRYYRVVQVSSP